MTELERQAVQKIVDTHFRLNRLAGVESNVNFGLIDNICDLPGDATPHDDRIEVMIERCGSFEKPASPAQSLQFTHELERLQPDLREREFSDSFRQPEEIKPDTFNTASFFRNAPELV
jgi:hypothetical protein